MSRLLSPSDPCHLHDLYGSSLLLNQNNTSRGITFIIIIIITYSIHLVTDVFKLIKHLYQAFPTRFNYLQPVGSSPYSTSVYLPVIFGTELSAVFSVLATAPSAHACKRVLQGQNEGSFTDKG